MGFGVYKLTRGIHVGHGPGGLPTVFWIFLVLLVAGSVWAFRPRGFTSAALMIVRWFVLGLLWLGVVIYLIAATLF